MQRQHGLRVRSALALRMRGVPIPVSTRVFAILFSTDRTHIFIILKRLDSTMGRKKKHHTEEEKIAARRERQKGYRLKNENARSTAIQIRKIAVVTRWRALQDRLDHGSDATTAEYLLNRFVEY